MLSFGYLHVCETVTRLARISSTTHRNLWEDGAVEALLGIAFRAGLAWLAADCGQRRAS